MITVGMTFKIVLGKEEQFEDAYKKILNVLNHAEGHSGSRLYRDSEDPSTFLLMSEWLDQRAFDICIDSKQYREAVDWNREQILAGKIHHRIF